MLLAWSRSSYALSLSNSCTHRCREPRYVVVVQRFFTREAVRMTGSPEVIHFDAKRAIVQVPCRAVRVAGCSRMHTRATVTSGA
jgi:hypothetical protein